MRFASFLVFAWLLALRVSAQSPPEGGASDVIALPASIVSTAGPAEGPDVPVAEVPARAGPRLAPLLRVGFAIEPLIPAPGASGLLVQGFAEWRFRAPVAVRLRLRRTGFAHLGGAFQGLGAADATAGLDLRRFGLWAGVGAGRVARRVEQAPATYEETTFFGAGAYFASGLRIGHPDSFGLELEGALTGASYLDSAALPFELDIALHFPAGPRGLFVLRSELGNMTTRFFAFSVEGRVRLASGADGRASYVTAGFGGLVLAGDGVPTPTQRGGLVLSLGTELRFGARGLEREEEAVDGVANVSPAERLSLRGRRLRRAGAVLLGCAFALELTGGALLATANDYGRAIAGASIGMTGSAALVSGAVMVPVGKRQMRRAAIMQGWASAWSVR